MNVNDKSNVTENLPPMGRYLYGENETKLINEAGDKWKVTYGSNTAEDDRTPEYSEKFILAGEGILYAGEGGVYEDFIHPEKGGIDEDFIRLDEGVVYVASNETSLPKYDEMESPLPSQTELV